MLQISMGRSYLHFWVQCADGYLKHIISGRMWITTCKCGNDIIFVATLSIYNIIIIDIFW